MKDGEGGKSDGKASLYSRHRRRAGCGHPGQLRQAINREMRKVDAPTDVLSFPEFELRPGELPSPEDADPGSGLVPLGDMAISMERVSAQAREYNHSKRRELSYLVVHSVLHLLGYDHLDEGPMKARMRAREEAILESLGIVRDQDKPNAAANEKAQES